MPYAELDVRFADEAGRYCWCKLRVAAQFDGIRTLFKAVGIITDGEADRRISPAMPLFTDS